MNQAELAQMLERHGVRITGSQISNIEHGKKSPSWEVAVALANVLGVSLDYLAMRTDVQDVAGEADVPPHYLSAQGDEIATIVDALPPFRRDEILAHARIILAWETENERDIEQAMRDAIGQMSAAGLVLGDQAMRAIRAAMLAYATTLLGSGALRTYEAAKRD